MGSGSIAAIVRAVKSSPAAGLDTSRPEGLPHTAASLNASNQLNPLNPFHPLNLLNRLNP
jgi:hypothetical protein